VRFAFERLPGARLDVARPAIEVVIPGPQHTVTALGRLDTGSVHNRFAHWVADFVGLDVAATQPERIAVGGVITEARTVTCSLQLGEFAWAAPVAFCDPWPFDFQILGQLGFFRWFRVVIDAADETLEVTPNET
jgi:hypothetical protein